MRKLILLVISVFAFSVLSAQTYLVPASGSNTVTASSGVVYDPGGTSDYANYVDGTLTIYPAIPGSYVKLDFTSFNTESCCDYLTIYDGISTSVTSIANLKGSINVGSYYATNSSGALTLQFHSDGSAMFSGFEASISYMTSIQQSDLIIQSPSSNATDITQGTALSASFSLKNLGSANAISPFAGIYLSSDNVLDSSDIFLTYCASSTVNAGSSVANTTTVTIPASAPLGDCYLLFQADCANQLNESLETNNIASLPIKVLASNVDLYLRPNYTPTSSIIGGSVALSGYVFNNGSNNIISLPTTIGYYLSTDNKLDVGDISLTTSTVSAIYAGGSSYYSSSIIIPAQITAGNYYIIVKADPINSIAEVNEDNNIIVSSIEVNNKAVDLSLLNVNTTQSFITPGDNVYLSYSAVNESFSSQSTPMAFYLSTDSIFDINDSYLSNANVYFTEHSLVQKSLSITIPQSFTPGNYFILSSIDYTNDIAESREDNNIFALPIIIQSAIADVEIINQNVSTATLTGGETTSVTYNLINNGNVSLPSISTAYYLSTDSVFDINDVFLNSTYNGTISLGSSVYNYSTITIPVNIAVGDYYLLCFADYSSVHSEVNESNNIKCKAITVLPVNFNWVIASAANQILAKAGEYINVSATLKNAGTTALGSCNIGYYLSNDSILDANDTYLNCSIGVTLLPGSTSSMIVTQLTIPATVSNGDYYILYYSDYSNLVVESNENDNVCARPITIGSTSSSVVFVPSSGTSSVTTCSGVLYDHAGVSSYNDNINGSMTIYPGTVGSFIGLSFVSFSTEACCDHLLIYDGVNTSAPLLGNWVGNNNPGNVYATNHEGALTLNFYSDGSGTSAGFEANISCNASTPLADFVIQNDNVLLSPVVLSGDYVTSTCSIKNQGGLLASSSSIGYYLSNDTIKDANDVYLTSYSGGSIGGGLSLSRTISPFIPVGTTPGNYYLLLCADYQNTVNESNENNNVRYNAISVVLPKIDLSIVNPTLSVSSVISGSSVTASYSIKNLGNTILQSSNVAFYLSQDTVLDVADTYISNTNSYTVNVGSLYLGSSIINIPITTTLGNYYVIFSGDYTNLIAESNENNNLGYARLSVVPSEVDLFSVNHYLSNNTVAAGASVTANCYVFNKGNSYVTTNDVGFYFSLDSIFDVNDIYLNSYSGYSLSANTSNSSSRNLIIPSTVQPGDYYILFYSDYANKIVETNEINNLMAIPVKVVSPVNDLMLMSSLVGSSRFVAGTNVSTNVSVFNSGNITVSLSNISYYLSNDSLYDNSDVFISNKLNSNLNVGATYDISNSLTIPVSITPGDYYLIQYVDPQNLISEQDEINNIVYNKVTVLPILMDLFWQNVRLSNSISSPGNSLTFNASIFNNGNTSVSTCNLAYYLSCDTLKDNSDIFIGSSNANSIYANYSLSNISAITIPANTALGNYYVLAIVDNTNSINETNESNNLEYLPISIVAPTIDLRFTGASTYQSSIVAGNTCDISVNLRNDGTVSCPSINVGYYLSTNNTYDASDVLLTSTTTTNLNFASSTELISYPIVPLSTTPGIYYIICFADNTLSITEPDETDNFYSVQISVTAAYVDLITQSVSVSPYNTVVGSTITANSYLKNQGNSAASVAGVGFYLSTNLTYDASDIFLGYQSELNLQPGASNWHSANLTLPSSLIPGTYYILFYADYLNAENESDETNNVSSAAININMPDVDLITSFPSAPNTVYSGELISLSCYIINQGSSYSASSDVGFYLSNDSLWDNDDFLLMFSTGGSLKVGSSGNIIADVRIPVETYGGDYYILFCADYSKSIPEISEANNVSYRKITVIDESAVEDMDRSVSSLVTVSPNPTSDFINLNINNADEIGEMQLSLFAANGQQIFSERIDNNGSPKLNKVIDIEKLCPGVYYLKVIANGRVSEHKVMVY